MVRLSHSGLACAALVLAMLIWASSFVALKLAFRTYDPMVVLFGRMALASACFLIVLPRLARGVRVRTRDLKWIAAMALCEPCLYFLFEAKALELTTASQAGMITALLPMLVAVSARFVLGERLPRRAYGGLLLAVVGACWLSASGRPEPSAPNPPLGNLLEFLAMVCATGGILTLKSLTRRYSPLFLTAVQAVFGAVFYLPMLFLPTTTLPATMEPAGLAAVIYLGIVVTLGAYGLYNFGVSRIPASRASGFINLIPVFTLALGTLVLGESFTVPQYFASALVFLGIGLSQKPAGAGRADTAQRSAGLKGAPGS
jgi:drug/metabolite transporter (DMT)-like permease